MPSDRTTWTTMLVVLLFVLTSSSTFAAKKILISASEPDAVIWADGQMIGYGKAEIEVRGGSCVSVQVVKEGYLTGHRDFCRGNDHAKLPKTFHFKMEVDAAFTSSVQNSMINRWISLPAHPNNSETSSYKLLSRIVTDYFDVLEVTDKETGYLRTHWAVESYPQSTVRTRLIIKLGSNSPLTYKVKLVSEIADATGTNTDQDHSFRAWDRVLRKYEDLEGQMQSRMLQASGSNPNDGPPQSTLEVVVTRVIGALALNDLSDVSIPTDPQEGDVLKYINGIWTQSSGTGSDPPPDPPTDPDPPAPSGDATIIASNPGIIYFQLNGADVTVPTFNYYEAYFGTETVGARYGLRIHSKGEQDSHRVYNVTKDAANDQLLIKVEGGFTPFDEEIQLVSDGSIIAAGTTAVANQLEKPTDPNLILYIAGSTGDDANDGRSPTTPKKTFNPADIAAGGWVVFKGGEALTGQFSPKGGTDINNPISYCSYDGRAIIDGAGQSQAIFIQQSFVHFHRLEVTNQRIKYKQGITAGAQGLTLDGIELRNIYVHDTDNGIITSGIVNNIQLHDIVGQAFQNAGIYLANDDRHGTPGFRAYGCIISDVAENDGLSWHRHTGNHDYENTYSKDFELWRSVFTTCFEEGIDVTSGDGLLIQDCIGYNNGWGNTTTGATVVNVEYKNCFFFYDGPYNAYGNVKFDQDYCKITDSYIHSRTASGVLIYEEGFNNIVQNNVFIFERLEFGTKGFDLIAYTDSQLTGVVISGNTTIVENTDNWPATVRPKFVALATLNSGDILFDNNIYFGTNNAARFSNVRTETDAEVDMSYADWQTNGQDVNSSWPTSLTVKRYPWPGEDPPAPTRTSRR